MTVVYKGKVAITTQALREIAISRIKGLLDHLDGLNIGLVSIIVEADKTVTVTLSKALPANHVDHLGLVVV